MAGVSDLPQRELCIEHGAAYCVAEMVTSDISLWQSRKTQSRLRWQNSNALRVMQIAGAEPQMLAEATRAAELAGAQVVDINMGCPAKKVCSKAAGSALLKDETLVAQILEAVVAATKLPVTLKIRTGWDTSHKNAVSVARLAEQAGVALLTVHGRTRACRFEGTAEYDTIAEVVAATKLPVVANGDIDSPSKAAQVLAHTGAAAVMVGRASRGNPWLFSAINQYLNSGLLPAKPQVDAICRVMTDHILRIHEFYGDVAGPRIARKHFGWYLCGHFGNRKPAVIEALRRSFNTLTTKQEQRSALSRLGDRLQQLEDQAA